MSYKNIKTAIVCMVNDSQEYLSEFIFYHLNLVDHIFLIDHNSERDLRNLSIQNITFIRSNQKAQFQSECTNIVIEHFDIKKKFDWLFVLDIDEFLPFTDRLVFQSFLNKHHNEHTIQFFWKNGVPFHKNQRKLPSGLIDCCSIRFFSKNSINSKTFVNIKKVNGDFFVPTGAHRIDYMIRGFFSFNFFRRRYKSYPSFSCELPLFHIVAFDKNSFVKKIKRYVEQMKYREHIKGQGGWVVRNYPQSFEGETWLWYIANFRVTNSDNFFEVKPQYFEEKSIFEHLQRDKIIALRKKILSLPRIHKIPATENEKKYISQKIDDGDIFLNLQWFTIDDNNEVRISIPRNLERKIWIYL